MGEFMIFIEQVVIYGDQHGPNGRDHKITGEEVIGYLPDVVTQVYHR